ncbi:MAG: acyloxyacyl hydrolase [Saprospiraceae bacterium]|nr:acyloxyacyl hydrolase [Saprospiraceae bacterium]
MWKFKIVFYTILFLFQNGISAQEGKIINGSKVLGLRVHQGSVLIHSEDVRPIQNSFPTGLEFDLTWHKTTDQAWNSCLCYPKLGVALTFWDYDNPEVLGKGITSMFYLEPVFGAFKKLSLSIRAGVGLSYQNKPYDEIKNPDNLSYSTRIAFPLQLGCATQWRLSENWFLSGAFLYNHFSNGGIREPNKGINWPTLSIGADYYLKSLNFHKKERSNWKQDGIQKRIDLTFFMGYKQIGSGPYFLSPGFEIKGSKQIARFNAITVGAEGIYDNGIKFKIEEVGENESPIQGSLAVGHEFLLGKFLFSQQFGVYVYKPYSIYSDFYQRYGLTYRINQNLQVGFNLKVYGHVANFTDVRIGYTIN